MTSSTWPNAQEEAMLYVISKPGKTGCSRPASRTWPRAWTSPLRGRRRADDHRLRRGDAVAPLADGVVVGGG